VRLEDGASSAELGRSTSFNWGAGKAPRTRSRRERISGEEGGLYLSLIASSRERGLAAGGRRGGSTATFTVDSDRTM